MATQATTPTEQNEQEQSNPVGRPLKFKTVEDLDVAINGYFDSCDPHVEERVIEGGINQKGETIWKSRAVMTEQKPYVMAGLARALGVDRRTLLNYKNRDEFFPSIQTALNRCEEYAEGQLFGPYSNGAKFALSNNYSTEDAEWSDKKALDHTTKGNELKGASIVFEDDPTTEG